MKKCKYMLEETASTKNGEITTTSKKYLIIVKKDEFYLTYIENMSGFFKLKSAIDIKVLAKMCTLAEFNTGIVNLSTASRRDIESALDISKQQLTNSIAALKLSKMIAGEKSRFTINPSLFWKGEESFRQALLKDNKIKVTFELGYNSTSAEHLRDIFEHSDK